MVLDLPALTREKKGFSPVPIVNDIKGATIQRNFLQIKQDIEDLKISELERIRDDPNLARFIVAKL